MYNSGKYRLGLDAQLFLKGEKTGIAWCADNLIKELEKDIRFSCELNFFSLGYKGTIDNTLAAYLGKGEKKECYWFNDTLYKMLWPFISVPYSLFFGKKQDIVQFFNFVIPPGVSGKMVTIVHDMAYLACPETVRKKTRLWLKLTMKGTCTRADKILTVSEFSKREIIKFLHVEPEKIEVIPNGVDLSFFHPNYGHEQVDKIKKQYNIGGDYFLYLGTLEPRKNIEGIIMAYSKFLKEYSTDSIPILVIAGKKGWFYERIFDLVREEKLDSKVVFAGYVSEKDAPILMKGAVAFIFPSLYEGFGMPPLEAMACGTPVISSNTTSLPEVIGEAGVLVSPQSTEQLKDAMERLWKSPQLRAYYSSSGIERAKQFTWKKSAEKLCQIYIDLLEK